MRMCESSSLTARAPTKAAMVMVSFKDKPNICVISLSHNKAPDRAPAGQSMFSVFTEHKYYDKMAAMKDDNW